MVAIGDHVSATITGKVRSVLTDTTGTPVRVQIVVDGSETLSAVDADLVTPDPAS